MEGEGQHRDSGQVEKDLKIHAREFSDSVTGDRGTGKKELCSPKQYDRKKKESVLIVMKQGKKALQAASHCSAEAFNARRHRS